MQFLLLICRALTLAYNLRSLHFCTSSLDLLSPSCSLDSGENGKIIYLAEVSIDVCHRVHAQCSNDQLDDALIAVAWVFALGNSVITHLCKHYVRRQSSSWLTMEQFAKRYTLGIDRQTFRLTPSTLYMRSRYAATLFGYQAVNNRTPPS